MARGTEQVKLPRLWTRNGVHYFRIKVPADLLAHYAPKLELKWSLKTNDLRRAKIEVNKASVSIEAEFERLRRTYTASTPARDAQASPVSMIDDAFIESVCSSWLRDSLEADVAMRTDPRVRSIAHEVWQEGALENLELLRAALADGKTSIIDEPLRIWLQYLGITVATDVASYRRLAFALLQTAVEEAELLAKRDRGEIVATEAVAPAAKSDATAMRRYHGISVRNLFDDWNSAATRRAKTSKDYEGFYPVSTDGLIKA